MFCLSQDLILKLIKKILWNRPIGTSSVNLGNKKTLKVQGSDVWGGILVTDSELIIATGTRDAKIYFYDTKSGDELHSIQMDAPGSSPPISYLINNEQFISVIATGGGQLLGTGNKIYGYKLQN